MYKKGKSLEIVDSALASSSSLEAEEVGKCIQLALLCTQSDPKLRPTMRRVVVMLSRKPAGPGGHMEEPTRPGLPGTRYSRRKHPKHSSLSSTSYSHTSDSSNNGNSNTILSTTVTATTSLATSEIIDPRGKRPMLD